MGNSQNQTSWTYNANDLISPALQKVLKIVNDVKAKTGDLESKWGSSMTNMKQKVEQFKAANSEAFQTVINEVPGLDRALNMLTNPYVLGAAAAVAFGAAAVGATSQSLTWEAAIAKANVTAQKSGAELEAMDMRMRQMAATSSVEFNQVPEAFTRIISSVGDADKSFAILEPTLRAAKASFTDVTLVAGAATNVMNSIKGATPERVFDVLFATMNKGNAEFKDIANYLPKLLPFANNVGLSLEEAAGAWALFTAKGQSTEAATTGLQNAFRALANKDRIKDLNAMGIEVFDLQGKTRPLTSIIQDLNSKFDGLTDAQRVDKLGKLGLDAEAASAFSIMSMNAQDLTGFIDATTNSMGALNDAVEFGQNKLADWQQVKNEIMATIVMPLGDIFLPLVGDIITNIKSLIEWFQRVTTFMRDTPLLVDALKYTFIALASAITLSNLPVISLTISTIALSAATSAYNTVLSITAAINPYIAIAVAIIAVVAWIKKAYDGSQDFRASVAGVYEVFVSLLPLLYTGVKLIWQLATRDFSGMAVTFSEAVSSVVNIRDTFNKGFNAKIQIEKEERVNQIIEQKTSTNFDKSKAGEMVMDITGIGTNVNTIPQYLRSNIPQTPSKGPELKGPLLPTPSDDVKSKGIDFNNQLANNTSSKDSTTKDGISISGSGGGGKSITIRIDRMIGVEKLTLNSISEGVEDIGKALLQQLMMAIAQAEGTV